VKPEDIGQGKDAAMITATHSKRAYMKPAFRHEAVFDTMSLACGKIAGTQGQCGVVRKLS
jgi:hypothetical protein